jgi:hypothetical protein
MQVPFAGLQAIPGGHLTPAQRLGAPGESRIYQTSASVSATSTAIVSMNSKQTARPAKYRGRHKFEGCQFAILCQETQWPQQLTSPGLVMLFRRPHQKWQLARHVNAKSLNEAAATEKSYEDDPGHRYEMAVVTSVAKAVLPEYWHAAEGGLNCIAGQWGSHSLQRAVTGGQIWRVCTIQGGKKGRSTSHTSAPIL